MCQKSEKLGRRFIVGTSSFKFPTKAWIYISDYCGKNSVPVYGPFHAYRKHLQMWSHLDLIAVKVSGEVFLIKYDTKDQFEVFDSLFGAYSRYGSSQNKPGMGKTLQVEEYHLVYSMGNGLDNASSNTPVSLSKENSNDFGVDFWYKATTSELEIALRYKLCAVTNSAKIKKSLKREHNIMVNQCQ